MAHGVGCGHALVYLHTLFALDCMPEVFVLGPRHRSVVGAVHVGCRATDVSAPQDHPVMLTLAATLPLVVALVEASALIQTASAISFS